MLYRVKAPHFTAGVIVKDGVVIKAAPILRWTMGRRISDFETYCNIKKWSVEYVTANFRAEAND